MSTPPPFDRAQRWRMILGPSVENEARSERNPTEPSLQREQAEMDETLSTLYGPSPDASSTANPKARSANLGASQPRVAKWLGNVRKYFERDVVMMLQRDALRHSRLREVLLDRDTLEQLTPSVELAASLLALKDAIPDASREQARALVREVVRAITEQFQPRMERSVRGALQRQHHHPIPSLPNLDWSRTIRRNLANYLPAQRTIVPERLFFHAKQLRAKEHSVIVCLDQSGSMAESVVYGAVMASIFASLPAIETHLVAFDTEVVDLSAHVADPVEVLFGVQLGGGTDIHRAVQYASTLVHQPSKTLLLLITDLHEGGDEDGLVESLSSLVQSGVRALTLLALDDSGVPAFHAQLAQRVSNVGVPCFACTPHHLPHVIEQVLAGDDVVSVASRYDTRTNARKET